MSKKKETKEVQSEADSPDNPDVTVVVEAQAPKLSARDGSGIEYQVGRIGRDVFIRIAKNHGGGSFSKEWVPVEKIRAAITPEMRGGQPFRCDALASAIIGRSQCNVGFVTASLRHLGIFSAAPEHKGMSVLTGDLEAFAERMIDASPLLGPDGQPVTAKLRPEPKETRFRPKTADSAPGDVAQGDGESGQEETAPPQEAAPHDETTSASEDDAKAKRNMVRVSRKTASRLGLTPVTDAPSAEADAD